MKLYMVRHGESEHNAKRIHQTLHNPLSEMGTGQAKALAARVKMITDIDFILSSDLKRAEQTAKAISEAAGLEIIYTDLARERKMPAEAIGLPWEGEEMNKILAAIREHMDDPSWHYSDEENFYEQRSRAKKLLDLIDSYGEKNILLVSHGQFIKLVVGIMMFGEEVTAHEFAKMEDFMKSKNTGVTVCQKKDGQWQLVTWNDHSHLG